MMDLRTRLLAIGGISIIIIITIVAVGSWMLKRSQPPEPSLALPNVSTLTRTGEPVVNPSATAPPMSSGNEPVAPASLPVPAPSALDESSAPLVASSIEAELSSIALSFAEVFGSFSNQGGFQNLERLRFIMSRSMNAWTDEFIAKRSSSESAQSPALPSLYYGITTYALSATVDPNTEPGKISIRVRSQRKEVRGIASNATLLYQDLVVLFNREDGVWKVESALWQSAQPSAPLEP